MTIADHVDSQTSASRTRVLIVGGGIAGSTLGALMRQADTPAAVIERGGEHESGGYMLGLMPWGGRVISRLGLTAAYREQSVEMTYYAMYGRKGQLRRRYPLGPAIGKEEDWRGIERGVLLGMLRAEVDHIEYGASVVDLVDSPGEVHVIFNDGSQSSVDLVVAADGIHSLTRRLVFSEGAVDDFDTGWGGFVVWSSYMDDLPHTYRELWEAGWGIGLYPVLGRTGLFLAGRHSALRDRDAPDYARELVSHSLPEPFEIALNHLDLSTPGVYWPMADTRSREWTKGHCVLLGDAATAFLPTAGVGASAAMSSAATLADELGRGNPDDIDMTLENYERRQRAHVELAQRSSRNLSRYMFVDSRIAAWGRDQLLRLYTPSMMLRSLTKVMNGR